MDLSGTEGSAKVSIYTDGSKTENHVGASIVAVKNSTEIHTETQRLSITCTVFQAELCGIIMAVDWIQIQGQKTSSYAIYVDSKATLLAIANKHTTRPLAVATRLKINELRNSSVDKKNQLDVTFCILYFSSNSCSTCFGQPCAHHQELTTA